MTEDEAKTKWCPFARVATPITEIGTDKVLAATGANRLGLSEKIAIAGSTERSNPESARCIGSACMAFRQHGWRDKEDGQIKSMAYGRADPQFWEPMFHCGLAGRP